MQEFACADMHICVKAIAMAIPPSPSRTPLCTDMGGCAAATAAAAT